MSIHIRHLVFAGLLVSSPVQATSRSCEPIATRDRSTMRGEGAGSEVHETEISRTSMLERWSSPRNW